MMTELECSELLEKNPFARGLKLELLEIKEGYIKAKMPFDTSLTNVYGDLHGGALYAAADTLCGIAASTYGYYVTTVDGSIQYLKAGRNTDYVICEGKVIKPGMNLSVVNFTVEDAKGLLLNTGTFTFYNIKKR